MMKLIRRTPADRTPRDFAETVVIGDWFWKRRTGSQGGNTRAFWGAYVYGWIDNVTGYAPRRFWSFFGLATLHHVDDKDGTLKAKHPGWSWTFAKIAPKLNFKKAEKYVW